MRRRPQDVAAVCELHRHAGGAQQRNHVGEIVGKCVERVVAEITATGAQHRRRHRVGAGSASDTQVDTARVGGLKQGELLGHC